MNRSEFLKTIGLGGSGILIPGASSVHSLKQKPVKIYDNYVKGVLHYDFEKVKARIETGVPLILHREIENVHDSFAIEVY